MIAQGYPLVAKLDEDGPEYLVVAWIEPSAGRVLVGDARPALVPLGVHWTSGLGHGGPVELDPGRVVEWIAPGLESDYPAMAQISRSEG